MDSPMHELPVSTHQRNEMIDVTSLVQKVVSSSHAAEGIVVVYVPHTTAGVTINEGADPSVQQDIMETLKRLVPEHGDYDHEEGNSDAHVKASLIGSSVTIILHEGHLMLGTWQHIFFYEGDGPRQRTLYVKIIPDQS